MYTKEQLSYLIEQGSSNSVMAKKFNVSISTVARWLNAYGLVNSKNNRVIIKITKSEAENIIQLYADGHTCKSIAKMIDRHSLTVINVLKKSGIKIDKSRKGDKKTTYCIICGEHMSNYSYGANRCGTCNTNLRRYMVKLYAVKYKGGKCECCGWNGNVSGFDFHHESDKEFNLTGTNMAFRKWERVKKELDKCLLLCAICHRMEHNVYNDEKMIEAIKSYKGKIFTNLYATV